MKANFNSEIEKSSQQEFNVWSSQEEVKVSNRSSDPEHEIRDLKSKLRIITSKFASVRKERDSLKAQNKALQEEILVLQSNMRHMLPGFSDTSSTFFMQQELIQFANEFYRVECQDFFFDHLENLNSLKNLVQFFSNSFQTLTNNIINYFVPCEEMLLETLRFQTLEGPVVNVLRKAYQSNWQEILASLSSKSKIDQYAQEILKQYSRIDQEALFNFLNQMLKLLLCCYIADPPLEVDKAYQIGAEVEFNGVKMDSLDGFLRNKERCIILLPAMQKQGELVTRACVLSANYSF